MGSPIIGRTDCPECGFTGAHVKESPKCIYRFCPECGSMHHAKSDRQKADLAKKTRPAAAPIADPAPAPEPAPPVPIKATKPPAPPPPQPAPARGRFDL